MHQLATAFFGGTLLFAIVEIAWQIRRHGSRILDVLNPVEIVEAGK